MPTNFSISQAVNERGTFVVDVSFTDDDGNPVVPNAGLVWSLTKADRATIVNDREDEPITPAATVTIVLSGLDLALDAGKHIQYRYLVIEGTYDGALGSDLPIVDHLRFPISDIAKVPG